ncbi:MAG: c-type cytochrome biogenesis protein CcmI [Aestuariivirga sp.]
MFWLALILLCGATVVGVSVPLVRRYETGPAAAQETAVYQDQLEEVDRDLNSGNINATEAQAAKSEINRRLEKTHSAVSAPRPLTIFWRRASLFLAAGLVVIGSVGLYAVLGSPNQASPTGPDRQSQAMASIDTMIGKLHTQLKAHPDDVEGWRLLGLANFSMQRWSEAVFAYGKAVDLSPDNIDLKSTLVEAEVEAARGTVTPEAKALIEQVLAKNPKELRSRFYDALGHEQAGDKQGAYDRWLALLVDAPEDATWRSRVGQHVADLAKALGKDVPPAAQTAEGGQQAMIEAMVQKQADSLKANPKDLEGWQRLIRSYMVLKSPEKAKAAVQSAKQAFDSDQGSLAKLQATAEELGIN